MKIHIRKNTFKIKTKNYMTFLIFHWYCNYKVFKFYRFMKFKVLIFKISRRYPTNSILNRKPGAKLLRCHCNLGAAGKLTQVNVLSLLNTKLF